MTAIRPHARIGAVVVLVGTVLLAVRGQRIALPGRVAPASAARGRR